MLSAQHSEPANVMSTTSGDANLAYATTRTSTVAAEADGATMLVPNAMVRAEPTTRALARRPRHCQQSCRSPRRLTTPQAVRAGCVRPCLLARRFSLDVIKVAQDHRAAHCLEKCSSGYGHHRDARAA